MKKEHKNEMQKIVKEMMDDLAWCSRVWIPKEDLRAMDLAIGCIEIQIRTMKIMLEKEENENNK